MQTTLVSTMNFSNNISNWYIYWERTWRNKRYHCVLTVKWVQKITVPRQCRSQQPFSHSDLSARFVPSAQHAHNGLIVVCVRAETRARSEWRVPARAPILCALEPQIAYSSRVDKQSELWLPACMCGGSGLGVGRLLEKSRHSFPLFILIYMWLRLFSFGRVPPDRTQIAAARVQKSQQVGTSLGTESNWRQFWARDALLFFTLGFPFVRDLARFLLKCYDANTVMPQIIIQ